MSSSSSSSSDSSSSSAGANLPVPYSPTRSRQRAVLTNIANSARLQTCIRISRIETLEMFVNVSVINPAIGNAVEELIVSLSEDRGYPASLLRRCLGLTPNIDTLVLLLPTNSPATIFNGLVFARLRVFSTDLPHLTIRVFLTNNPSITSLALQSCGSRHHCPLRNVNLSQVSELQCPSRCLEGVARGQVVTATVRLTRMTSMAALALRALSTSPLYSLTVDFFPEDSDILARIAAAAPHLRKLKLIEKPHSTRRSPHVRRPWNDVRGWHSILLRLPCLEELLLRTPMSVVGARRSEQVVITGWANGTRLHGTRHPNLYHIGLLQQSAVPGTQRLSHWFKRSGAWERLANTLVDRTHSFVL